MLSELCTKLDPTNMIPHFPNPCNGNTRIFILLDVCHMLKLVRNTLADTGILLADGGKNLWQYIVSLQKLQDTEAEIRQQTKNST